MLTYTIHIFEKESDAVTAMSHDVDADNPGQAVEILRDRGLVAGQRIEVSKVTARTLRTEPGYILGYTGRRALRVRR